MLLTAFVVLILALLWHGTPSEDCAGVFLARDNESKTFESERAIAGVSFALPPTTKQEGGERKREIDTRVRGGLAEERKNEQKVRGTERNINERTGTEDCDEETDKDRAIRTLRDRQRVWSARARGSVEGRRTR